MAYTLQASATATKKDETQDQIGGPIRRSVLTRFNFIADFVNKHHGTSFLVNPLLS